MDAAAATGELIAKAVKMEEEEAAEATSKEAVVDLTSPGKGPAPSRWDDPSNYHLGLMIPDAFKPNAGNNSPLEWLVYDAGYDTMPREQRAIIARRVVTNHLPAIVARMKECIAAEGTAGSLNPAEFTDLTCDLARYCPVDALELIATSELPTLIIGIADVDDEHPDHVVRCRLFYYLSRNEVAAVRLMENAAVALFIQGPLSVVTGHEFMFERACSGDLEPLRYTTMYFMLHERVMGVHPRFEKKRTRAEVEDDMEAARERLHCLEKELTLARRRDLIGELAEDTGIVPATATAPAPDTEAPAPAPDTEAPASKRARND